MALASQQRRNLIFCASNETFLSKFMTEVTPGQKIDIEIWHSIDLGSFLLS